MNDLISIIMPAYNAEKTLVESIESVLSQTYPNWELLVVDDCSTDNTSRIIKGYSAKDSRIKYNKTKQNSRVAGARNLAIEKSNGNLIAFLDSDDVWEPEKLRLQLEFMKTTNAHMSCTSYQVIDVDSKELGKLMEVKEEMSYNFLLNGSKIGCLTVMIDTDKVSKEDIYMKNVGHEDYITWMRIAKKYGPIHGLNKNLAKYRVFEESLSGNKKKAVSWQYEIYRKEFNINFIKSVYHMFRYGLNSFTKYKKM